MRHIPDLIKYPVNSKHPTLRKYQRFFQHRDRFQIGDVITVIELFHIQNGIRKFNRINYYLKRCEAKTISIKSISAQFQKIKVTGKTKSAINTYDYEAINIDTQEVLENKIPRVSIYLDIFPAAYYEWQCGKRYFVTLDFAFEYSLVHNNRFKSLFNSLKAELIQGNIGYEQQKNGHIKKVV